jgi:hypothetical protein
MSPKGLGYALNPFEKFLGDSTLYVETRFLSANLDGSLKCSRIRDAEIIEAARRIFGIRGHAAYRGPDKEAFLTLCIDLWEEAHGKPR